MADETLKRIVELSVNAGPAIEELKRLNKGMQDNTASIDGMQQGLAQLASSAVDVFQGLAVLDLAKQFVEGVRSMIEEMDQLGKSAQVAGMSVEKLQELQYSLKLGAGLDSGEATAALTRFGDKLADVTNKTSDAARVMREMGITVNDDVDTALSKIAETFANAPDGINKTAIATELFGRNLAVKMIPFLNGGAQGIADMKNELNDLGGVMSGDMAKNAAQFDDNLTKLAQHSKALGVAITADLLPSLVELTNYFVKAAKEGNLFSAALKRYWENVQDFWTKAGRAVGLSSSNAKQTHEEVRNQQAAIDDLVTSYNKVRVTDGPIPDAHVAKMKAAGKAAQQAKSDFEAWMDSMLKIARGDDDLPAKIDWLTRGLAKLAAAGDTSSETWKKWNAELLKLQPDPVASALLKMADAAQKLDEANSDKMLEGLAAAMERLQAAGPSASSEVKALHDQILKIKADGGDAIAQVTIDLEKLQQQTQKNNADWEATEQLFAQGKISITEYGELLSKYLGKASEQTKALKADVFDLGKAIGEASAKFVTDFVDDFIDGLGKTQQSFADTITDMVKQLAKLIVQMQIAKAFASTDKGGGGLSDIISGWFKAAKGAAFASPNVQYMATGGILNSPTFFANGSRLAVAGEAGPEAVVPLKRNSSGDLGVSASPVTVNVINKTDATVSTSTKDNEDGTRQIDIYVERKVKELMSNGSMDKTMRSTYGLSRQPAAG